jgi:NAD(P)-dependent dehydrogenase (short-subunit alcohol dehydrogenase family)
MAENNLIYTFDLTGKVILITGGYGYLGKAITQSLLFHGAHVCVLGRSAEKFEKAFASEKEDKKLFFRECDVSSSESIAQAFRAIFNENGKIDVLINNAFFLKGQNPLSMTDEEWETGIDGTLNSIFRCIREVIPYIEKSSSPRIINVSSMYGMVAPDFSVYDHFPAFLNPPHYGAAKAGVIQLTKYYASYLGNKGITVNTVTPGPYPSLSVQENEEFIELLKAKTMLKRIGKPEELAGAFIYLSSDASGFMTGQNIVVDGGWTSI